MASRICKTWSAFLDRDRPETANRQRCEATSPLGLTIRKHHGASHHFEHGALLFHATAAAVPCPNSTATPTGATAHHLAKPPGQSVPSAAEVVQPSDGIFVQTLLWIHRPPGENAAAEVRQALRA
jgi:hypothetical protein